LRATKRQAIKILKHNKRERGVVVAASDAAVAVLGDTKTNNLKSDGWDFIICVLSTAAARSLFACAIIKSASHSVTNG
jgi:hypothetical protein